MEPAFPPDDQEARVVDLRPRAAARRLLDAESELDALRAHLDQVVAERDAARAAVRESQADALSVREELAGRLAAETAALSAVAVLRGQVEELRVRADARDARDHALAKLAGELAVTARTAREEVERHAAARMQAEAAVQVERKRVAEVEAALATERERAAHAEGALRSELEALRTARDRAVNAESEARSARRAELEALTAAGDRLRPGALAAVQVERKRVAEVEAALATERERAAHAEGALRSELEALRTARDRAVNAESEARSARRAELEALTAAGDRLRPVEVAAVPDGLILDLGRAADRLRHGALVAVEVPRRSALQRLAARLRGR